MQAETRGKVDELLLKQGELQARMQDAEQKLVNAGKKHEPEVQQSAGQLVSAKMAEEGVTSTFRGSRRVEVPRAAITSAPDSGGSLVQTERVGVILAPQRRLTIRDLVAPGNTDSNAVEYVRETGFTNNAAIVGEGMAKPYSDLKFALENANVRTIAHLFKGSRQILDDASALQSYIDARARYGLLLAEEAQLLYGNGTGNNLKGIIPQAQAYSAPAGVVVEAAQRIDRIRLALLQAMLAEFPATGVVLNPIDWAAIELLKDAEGRYIIGKPQEGTAPRLWNLPVVETQAIVQDQFLVGAFSLAAQIYDRMGIEVLVSTENDKDFENNMVTIRAEERLAFAVYRPEAFVTGPLTGE
ncbi:MAG TPA: phage major capsid protein, partial [Pseudomonas sp.]|uniref:phage major capsid protein n=1 Tax=Pseudomonas sp. TaxID=306 RepID=UPI002B46A0CB